MSKIDASLWRCTFRVLDDDGRMVDCDTVIIQEQMEEHLRSEHKRTLLSPGDVIPHFVLVRTATVGRGPGRRGKTDDQTEPMFDFKETR